MVRQHRLRMAFIYSLNASIEHMFALVNMWTNFCSVFHNMTIYGIILLAACTYLFPFLLIGWQRFITR